MIAPIVWMAVGYGVFLLLVAFGLDRAARRTARRATGWRSGAFTYHADHDAWVCPQDQWLWPQSFDPENRVMRYRATPAVCNGCPVKDTCTTSDTGREVTRNVDPWPASEAERFHRGIACTIAVLGVLWPLAVTLSDRTWTERAVLAGVVLLIAAGSRPLWSHLRRTTANFPENVPADVRIERLDATVAADAVAAAREARRRAGYRTDRRPTVPKRGGWRTGSDRFSTQWGDFAKSPNDEQPSSGWSRLGRR